MEICTNVNDSLCSVTNLHIISSIDITYHQFIELLIDS